MTLEEMKRIKTEHGLTYEMISEQSGVPLGTVQKIFAGISKAPRYSTLEALEKYFRGFDDGASGGRIEFGLDGEGDGSEYVAETEFRYAATRLSAEERAERLLASKHQGEFTVDDYYIISEAWRIELIDGVIYDMASPTYAHQGVEGGIYAQLYDHALERGDGCMPLISPLDVQLDEDDKTMVQPDVLIICDPEMLKKTKGKNVYGAPDFVLEVISPSSRTKDKVTKRDKYKAAGCREYWIVDTDKERVTVYDFENDVDGLYTFGDKIPVRISDGKCEIDFPAIKRYMERFETFD